VKLKINALLDYTFEQPCDVLLQIEAAPMAGQTIADAQLDVAPCGQLVRVAAQDSVGERVWLRAEGQVQIEYAATVSLGRTTVDWASLAKVPLHQLPGAAVPYLMPSRYCPSNRFEAFVSEEFGSLEGGAKIVAMRDWIAAHLAYVPGSSHAETTALDTFHDRAGICRDYAHLMVAFARAAEFPARLASAYAPGVNPPDFHAVAEIYLGGAWHLIDATGMASATDIAIIGIGRDAGDVAFLTAFGPLEMNSQSVSVAEIS
jgi:transglutaminase-like putative cysteine protease